MSRLLSIVIISALCLLSSCYRPSAKQSFDDLKVLQGTWTTFEGTKFSESWHLKNDSVLQGIGFSLSGTDTAFMELLVIETKGDSLYYGALVAENKGYVYFKLEEAGRDYWVFKNPAHDYPNIIEYKIGREETLETTTSNIRGNKKVVFKLRKVSP